MAIEDALHALLAGVAGGRRYWGRGEGVSAAAGAYLVLNRVSGGRDYTMAGPSGYVRSRFQLDGYADTYPAAQAAGAAARAVLSGYRGTQSGVRIMGIFIDGEQDLPATDAGEANDLFRRSMDLIVHHDE